MAFETPIDGDNYVTNLYLEHGLGANPSLEELEAKANELLSSPLTLVEGISMVLGRRVDASEIQQDISLGLLPLVPQEERFALLLMYKSNEQTKSDSANSVEL